MTAGVLSNTACNQTRALAPGERRQPAIRTAMGAWAARPALVHEIFGTFRSALVRRVRNPQDPEPHPVTGPAAAVHSHTRATRVPRRPCAREETTRRLQGCPLPPGGQPMDVTPTTAQTAIDRDDTGRANFAENNPLVQSNGARLRNTPRQCLSVRHIDGNDINLPDTCNRYPKNGGWP